jgi:hypothetical protein
LIERRRARFERHLHLGPRLTLERLGPGDVFESLVPEDGVEDIEPEDGFESDEVLDPGESEDSDEEDEAESSDEEVEVSEVVGQDALQENVQEGPQVYRSRMSRRRERIQQAGKARPKKVNVTSSQVKKASKVAIHTDTDLTTLKPGLKFDDGEAKVYSLGEILKKGFELIPWDGMWVGCHLLSRPS